MTGIGFDSSDLNKLVVDLTEAPAKAVGATAKAIKKTAFDIERDAKTFCPVDTGNLRNSITTTVAGIGGNVLEAEIGPTAEYAAFVEYGTSRMAPRAYMGPALDRNTPDFVRAIELAASGLL